MVASSCATHNLQVGDSHFLAPTDTTSHPVHTFFLVGDAGNAEFPHAERTLLQLQIALEPHGKNSTLLFLGDNIYPDGMPADEKDSRRALAEAKLNRQLEVAKSFQGTTVFLPGNHDWYSGLDGLHAQSETVARVLGEKKAFLPRKGCGIETLKINDHVALIVLDSEWFLQNWDRHPAMNDDCDIRTRTEFLDELKSEINKNQNKFTIIALHHPLVSYGPHGGVYSARKHCTPLTTACLCRCWVRLSTFCEKPRGRVLRICKTNSTGFS